MANKFDPNAGLDIGEDGRKLTIDDNQPLSIPTAKKLKISTKPKHKSLSNEQNQTKKIDKKQPIKQKPTKQTQKPKPRKSASENGTLTPAAIENGLFRFSEFPLDYRGEGPFKQFGLNIREEDIEFIKGLSKSANKPVWVIIRSMVETYKAAQDVL